MAITLTLENKKHLGYIVISSTNDLSTYDSDDVAKMRLKRKFNGENGGWITVFVKTISSNSDFTFTFNDKYCRSTMEYYYQLDYLNSDGGIVTSTTNTVNSLFDCIVLADIDTLYTTPFDTGAINTNSGTPYKKQLPINAEKPTYFCITNINYEEGSCQGCFLKSDGADVPTYEKQKSWKYRSLFKNWLTNGKSKILKDIYGDAWIIAVKTDTIKDTSKTSDYELEGARIISFEWFENGIFTSEANLHSLKLSSVTSADFSGV